MPTYEYYCKFCDHEFEVFQSITDKPKKTCPNCKKRGAQRMISAGAGILFKGSGFYETDYRSDNYKQAAAKDSESKSPPKSDSKSKGDSKDSSSSSSKKKTS